MRPSSPASTSGSPVAARRALPPLLHLGLLFLVPATLSGCGVSRSLHQAAVAALDESQAEVASLREKQALTSEAAAEEFRAQQQTEGQAARSALLEALGESLTAEAQAGRLAVRERGERIVIDLSQDLLFPEGSDRLGEIGAETVGSLATALGTLPRWMVRVEVHSDLDGGAPGSDASWISTATRAAAIVTRLVGAGLAPERLSATGMGSSRPRADNRSEPGRALNRRVEVVLVPGR